MRPRRHTYRLSIIRKRQNYTIDEAARLLAVSKGTVRNWFKAGLKTIDRVRPLLIHGSDLFAFLAARRQNRKRKCQATEMYCLRCRKPQTPFGLMVDVVFSSAKMAQVSGLCSACDARMNRRASLIKLPDLLKSFGHVTLANPHLIERLPPSLNCYLKEPDHR